MPKNKGAGGKNRRKGKSMQTGPKELVYKGVDEEYGQITKSLGNGYMEVMCFATTGNVLRRAHIRGNMRKRVWLAVGDIVLVNVRGYQDNICDILLKYTPDEARMLRTRHQLPESVDINKTDMVAEDDKVIFNDNEESGSDSDEYWNERDNSKKQVPQQNRNLDLPDSDSETADIDDL